MCARVCEAELEVVSKVEVFVQRCFNVIVGVFYEAVPDAVVLTLQLLLRQKTTARTMFGGTNGAVSACIFPSDPPRSGWPLLQSPCAILVLGHGSWL